MKDKIAITLVLIAGAFLLWWIFFQYGDFSLTTKQDGSKENQGYLTDTPFGLQLKEDSTEVPDEITLSPIPEEYDSWTEYITPSYNFSFRHPAVLK
ncbi:MAG: hypothetical protein CMI53_02540 [Parcubacteria group bacterium]|nr:hypothetical protein [Parcubacteria group bacterium]|tara:strand:- start:102 stop:389 length:288 start_codon:yes stop_codon:yes gene_type:complete